MSSGSSKKLVPSGRPNLVGYQLSSTRHCCSCMNPNFSNKRRSKDSIPALTHVAAPSTVTGQRRGSHHVRRVLCALSQRRPLRAAVAVVRAVAWCVIDLVERGHADPFRGRPLLPLDDLASAMEARRVCLGVRPKVEEQKGVPFSWFHCNSFLCTF